MPQAATLVRDMYLGVEHSVAHSEEEGEHEENPAMIHRLRDVIEEEEDYSSQVHHRTQDDDGSAAHHIGALAEQIRETGIRRA